jgi:hypothetical protein
VIPSRFNPTPVQRLQQRNEVKGLVPAVTMARRDNPYDLRPLTPADFVITCGTDLSNIEARLNDQMMADLKYGTCTTASAAESILSATSVSETLAQMRKYGLNMDMQKARKAYFDLTLPRYVVKEPRPNAMPVSPPYVDNYVPPPVVERECFPRSTGYGEWKFDHVALKRRAEALVACLPRIMAELNADHIVVRGTSGTMMAPVLLYLMPDLKVVMLRKQSELRDSHGAKIEGTMSQPYRRGLIIDDMVASGRTVRGMIEDHECDIVGVLCHSGAELHGVNATRHALNTQGIPHYTFH